MVFNYLEPRPQHRDNTGAILTNGYLFFYNAGSTTYQKVYYDIARTIEAPNPVPLDPNGRNPVLYYDDAIYKVILKKRVAVTIPELPTDWLQIWEATDIQGGEVAGGTTVDALAIIDTITNLRDVDPTSIQRIFVCGNASIGDGGGGTYYWVPNSIIPDDNGIVIQKTLGGVGRWYRINTEEKMDLKIWGVVNGIANANSLTNNAIAYAAVNNKELIATAGTFNYVGDFHFTDTITKLTIGAGAFFASTGTITFSCNLGIESEGVVFDASTDFLFGSNIKNIPISACASVLQANTLTANSFIPLLINKTHTVTTGNTLNAYSTVIGENGSIVVESGSFFSGKDIEVLGTKRKVITVTGGDLVFTNTAIVAHSWWFGLGENINDMSSILAQCLNYTGVTGNRLIIDSLGSDVNINNSVTDSFYPARTVEVIDFMRVGTGVTLSLKNVSASPTTKVVDLYTATSHVIFGDVSYTGWYGIPMDSATNGLYYDQQLAEMGKQSGLVIGQKQRIKYGATLTHTNTNWKDISIEYMGDGVGIVAGALFYFDNIYYKGHGTNLINNTATTNMFVNSSFFDGNFTSTIDEDMTYGVIEHTTFNDSLFYVKNTNDKAPFIIKYNRLNNSSIINKPVDVKSGATIIEHNNFWATGDAVAECKLDPSVDSTYWPLLTIQYNTFQKFGTAMDSPLSYVYLTPIAYYSTDYAKSNVSIGNNVASLISASGATKVDCFATYGEATFEEVATIGGVLWSLDGAVKTISNVMMPLCNNNKVYLNPSYSLHSDDPTYNVRVVQSGFNTYNDGSRYELKLSGGCPSGTTFIDITCKIDWKC